MEVCLFMEVYATFIDDIFWMSCSTKSYWLVHQVHHNSFPCYVLYIFLKVNRPNWNGWQLGEEIHFDSSDVLLRHRLIASRAINGDTSIGSSFILLLLSCQCGICVLLRHGDVYYIFVFNARISALTQIFIFFICLRLQGGLYVLNFFRYGP